MRKPLTLFVTAFALAAVSLLVTKLTSPPKSIAGPAGTIDVYSIGLALQLHVPFQVCVLCGGLMSAPPSRPSNDEGLLNAPLRQSDRYAPDFLDRPGTLQAWR